MSTRLQIEPSERATIFAQLRRKRKYTSRRGGYNITVWTRPAPAGLQICYQVTKRHLDVRGHCYSVGESIDAVNNVLVPREAVEVVRPAFPPPRPAVALPMREWRLPYKDADL